MTAFVHPVAGWIPTPEQRAEDREEFGPGSCENSQMCIYMNGYLDALDIATKALQEVPFCDGKHCSQECYMYKAHQALHKLGAETQGTKANE